MLAQLAQFLEKLGFPSHKTAEMAAQLDKRARQLTEQTGKPYEESMRHLLALLRQGSQAQAQAQAQPPVPAPAAGPLPTIPNPAAK